ncbi:NAD(P)H-dependent glycerol-3-phosphate dehydrogenase [Thiomonas sp.]|jgi:glycerol-3-phosphate dehydrogenase (NAD(P)+)|uniref:NAD(P)H-dependent glycerol-3-phosphate dehydrogenase n=1 Tax=Thiomonas sp. TaxID=2047785 RepID=UPI002606EB4D|nr:NAD(P)H-dependent glycerol-3-phosphate dehydrogenase [Thiomonas sp.]
MKRGLPVSVLGAGAWGTALAVHAAARGDALLWARDSELLAQMRQRGENTRYLPGIELPEALRLEESLSAALRHAAEEGLLVLAVPVAGLRELAVALRHGWERGDARPPAALLILAKGFEQGSAALPHEVVAQELRGLARAPEIGMLSGPSFALEVARGLPVALVAAGAPLLSQCAVRALHGGAMRVYASDDLVGVAVGGAVKNVLAIACGVSDGLQQGANARAALITRGLAEMARLGHALGARQDTFMGLSGMGDLVLTCTGDLSRNRRVGLQLAAGKDLQVVVRDLGHVAEGVYTARTVLELGRRQGLQVPITEQVCALLEQRTDARGALEALLAREPRTESETGDAP